MKFKNLSVLLVLIASPIALFASSETDRKIEDTAKASYNYKTVLAGSVTVKASDGVVTLTGTVQDKDNRSLAADTVSSIPGVLSVDNQIIVAGTFPEHSDGWTAMRVRGKLLMNANVSAENTKVSVMDGIVTLTGTADNLAQKELTGVYAMDINGVRSVSNDITVVTKVPDATIGETVDDASITSQVKFALLTHGATSVLKTSVTTVAGIVHVTGEAGSDAEKSLVTKLASDIRGTKSVTNDMTVKAS